jgi:hypothetical protein
MSGIYNAATKAALIVFLTIILFFGEVVLQMWFVAIVLTALLWFASLMWNNWRGATELILLERITTFLARLIDSLMIYLIWEGHPFAELAICIPIYFALCVGFVLIYDWRTSRGVKMLALEELNNFKESKLVREDYESHIFKWIWDNFVQWLLKREIALFLVGSVFVLDPNFVTLFLRKGTRSDIWDFFQITLPSAAHCVISWTIIYFLALKGIWSYEETIIGAIKFVMRIIVR